MPKHFPLISKMMQYSSLRFFGTLCKISCFVNPFHRYLRIIYICRICLCFFQNLRL
ncbi:unnamed protein product [Onchocerca flexuosa]|uniref:Uncharacterized protein n=1 Tax=Onchocerca flexuosa TaxID=387005 RepID=A0A183HB05_9BILA|nr:unnamed protein product [Onchocerca flexuosa]